MGKYGLSNTEFEIVEFLWGRDEPVQFREILDYFNNELKKLEKTDIENILIEPTKIRIYEYEPKRQV